MKRALLFFMFLFLVFSNLRADIAAPSVFIKEVSITNTADSERTPFYAIYKIVTGGFPKNTTLELRCFRSNRDEKDSSLIYHIFIDDANEAILLRGFDTFKDGKPIFRSPREGDPFFLILPNLRIGGKSSKSYGAALQRFFKEFIECD